MEWNGVDSKDDVVHRSAVLSCLYSSIYSSDFAFSIFVIITSTVEERCLV
jgi:hypothetical protein